MCTLIVKGTSVSGGASLRCFVIRVRSSIESETQHENYHKYWWQLAY